MSPQEVVVAHAEAVAAGDRRRAESHVHPAWTDSLPDEVRKERFAEARAAARSGAVEERMGPARVRGELLLEDERVVTLVWRDGRWRIHSGVHGAWHLSSPANALQALLHGLETGDAELLLRVVPPARRRGMVTDDLSAWWSRERASLHRVATLGRLVSDEAIQQIGERAWVVSGDVRFEFIRVDSSWYVDTFE